MFTLCPIHSSFTGRIGRGSPSAFKSVKMSYDKWQNVRRKRCHFWFCNKNSMCTNNFEPISVYFVLKLNYPIFHPILIKLFSFSQHQQPWEKEQQSRLLFFQLIDKKKMILIHYIERSINGQIFSNQIKFLNKGWWFCQKGILITQ